MTTWARWLVSELQFGVDIIPAVPMPRPLFEELATEWQKFVVRDSGEEIDLETARLWLQDEGVQVREETR